MKRIVKVLAAVMAVAIVSVVLASCGNLSMGFGNFEFKKVHIHMGNFEGCLTIEKWFDVDGPGIEVQTKECGSLFLSEGTYVLVQDKCPICDE